jgi:flagellar hook-associated protein 2
VQTEITGKAGSTSTAVDESTLGQRMKTLNDYISRQKDRLTALEDRYYAQFAAMENALAQLESQSSYITNMLGGGGM